MNVEPFWFNVLPQRFDFLPQRMNVEPLRFELDAFRFNVEPKSIDIEGKASNFILFGWIDRKKEASEFNLRLLCTRDRNRTGTTLRLLVFETSASTDSATRAYQFGKNSYYFRISKNYFNNHECFSCKK